MSGPPRVRSTNIVPAEPGKKPAKKQSQPVGTNAAAPRGRGRPPPSPSVPAPRQRPTSASCSSEASCCSSPSSAASSSSTGFSVASSSSASSRSARAGRRRQQQRGKPREGEGGDTVDSAHSTKRCAWVTPTTDPLYAAFHDEEWGAPVHDDRKLFELLSLSGALAELTWPVILMKRHIFREVFLDFEPASVAKLNEKKIASLGNSASSLLSEPKLRAIIENARQICKITEEHGSFDKYIWNFVSHKPIASQFRYPRQVPVKTPKAENISKDLVRRGFRSVGPTIIYTFMQVAGLTNDHVIGCFRFQECLIESGIGEKVDILEARTSVKPDIHIAVRPYPAE